jgi:integrase
VKQEKQDRRSRRTRHLVHSALRELLLEKRYEAITIRDILHRAGIGSSTFYTHYYDLRHTISTFLAALKYPPNLVQDLLGHSDIATTLGVYTRADHETQRKMMDDLNDLFGGNF